MNNFLHKPCCPDGKKALKVAKRIKKKAQKVQINWLAFLLGKRLETKHIRPIELEEINDFVRLKKKQLKEKIFLGTFQLKLSKSYVGEVAYNRQSYIIMKDFAKQISDINIRSGLLDESTKIIAVEITSRHKRSKIKRIEKKEKNICSQELENVKEKFRNTYKIIIQYIPNMNSTKAIKGKKLLKNYYHFL